MKIEKNTVASLAYQLTIEDGVVVDQSTVDAPLDYLHGHNNLITGLERELEGKVAGDKFTVTIAPEDAYGEHNEDLVQRALQTCSKEWMSWKSACVSSPIQTKVQSQLKSLKWMAMKSWLMVTTCWLASH